MCVGSTTQGEPRPATRHTRFEVRMTCFSDSNVMVPCSVAHVVLSSRNWACWALLCRNRTSRRDLQNTIIVTKVSLDFSFYNFKFIKDQFVLHIRHIWRTKMIPWCLMSWNRSLYVYKYFLLVSRGDLNEYLHVFLSTFLLCAMTFLCDLVEVCNPKVVQRTWCFFSRKWRQPENLAGHHSGDWGWV